MIVYALGFIDFIVDPTFQVLGDMLELGKHAPKLHAALAEQVLDSRADKVFLAGPEMKALAAFLETLSGPIVERAAAAPEGDRGVALAGGLARAARGHGA